MLIRDELNLLPPQIKTEKKVLFAGLDLEWLQDDLSAGVCVAVCYSVLQRVALCYPEWLQDDLSAGVCVAIILQCCVV